jgi:Nitrate and nitrite sensing
MLHRRSIRLRIIVLVIVPVIALVALYGVIVSLTLGNLLTLRHAAKVRQELSVPIAGVQIQLAKERKLALAYLARPGYGKLSGLLSQEHQTDLVVTTYHNAATRALASGASAGERQAISEWNADLAGLRELRIAIDSFQVRVAVAAGDYSTILSGGDQVVTQALLPLLSSQGGIQATSLLAMDSSLQELSEEGDLVRADLIKHSFPQPNISLVDHLAWMHQQLWNQTYPGLDPAYQNFLRGLIPSSDAARLATMESSLAAGPASAGKLSLATWTSTTTAYENGFRLALQKSAAALASSTKATASASGRRLILLGSLGLLAILIAASFGALIARGLIRQLVELRSSAVELSDVQLPDVIRRLRAGDDIDADASVARLEAGSDEVGQVRQAFNSVARTAIAAAVDEVKIRHGVNDVFRNLARRSQSLLARQLQLLDDMERRAHDPDQLADLFRVDHLTTRMRRHAEGLLIVAGGTSGRTRREPVPIVDVMRAAVAEVEDYTRIRVTSRTSSAVGGHAVADVIHLLAELVENATTYSPADTPVRIDANRVARGVVIEIEDHGLGMGEGQLTELNATLDDPPQFDLSGSDQLGLFIAGQLAKRHEVKVSLRDSPYGGVVAVVLIPSTLIVDTDGSESEYPLAISARGPVPELAAGPDTAASITAAITAAAAILGGTEPPAPPAIERAPETPGEATRPGHDRTPDSTGQPAAWPESAPALPSRQPALPTRRPAQPDRASGQPNGAPGEPDGAPGLPRRAPALPSRAPGLPSRVPSQPDLAPVAADLTTPTNGHPAEPVSGGFFWNEDGIGIGVPEQAKASDADLIDLDGLPMRVRQASLAPQLRQQPIVVQPEQVVTAPPESSPEEARSMFAALQQGWERGRAEPAQAHDGAEEIPAEATPAQQGEPGSPGTEKGRKKS